MLNVGLKSTQNKTVTVFNKVQLICNFFLSILNIIFVLIFFFRFAIKTRKCSNCLRKFLIFFQRQSCLPFFYICYYYCYYLYHFFSYITFDQISHHFLNESFLHEQISSKMSAFFDSSR